MNFKSKFLQEFQARGFFAACTHENELDEILTNQKITAYIGFDCTAKSLHVGSLMQIMILRLLQKHGHKPLVLLGGGTTKIGDPSGKDEARKVLSENDISDNLNGIRKTLEKFISFEVANAAEMVNNNDWLKDLNYLEFLRDIGRHFSINRMLTFDSVKLRLEREQPLSFLEFNYMILQAYDFYYLNKEKNCVLQIGGSDQWGNIVNGVELTRKMGIEECIKLEEKSSDNRFVKRFKNLISIPEADLLEFIGNMPSSNDTEEFSKEFRQREDFVNLCTKIKNIRKECESFGLTSPLLTTSDGKKMGKTADGAVWLDSEILPAFDYFQYFRNTHDADVGKFLKLFTDLSLEEIEVLVPGSSCLGGSSERFSGAMEVHQINKAKEILAFEATKICHGKKAASDALQKAREIFVAKNSAAFEEKEVFLGEEKAKKLVDVIFEIGASESKGAAKKLIEGKAVKINGEVILDIHHTISNLAEFELSVGKKKFFKILVK